MQYFLLQTTKKHSQFEKIVYINFNYLKCFYYIYAFCILLLVAQKTDLDKKTMINGSVILFIIPKK